MKNKEKKGVRKGRLFLRKTINIILIATLSISCWEISKKQFYYKQSINTYNKIEKEKNNSNNMQEFLNSHSFDWITVTNTAINYPLMQYDNNDYYINHNYKDEEDIAGAIFYDSYDRPYNGTMTIIYGHSMKNGTMFNNLHYFQKDNNRFKESKLIINTKNKTKTYKPLGYYVAIKDKFYKNLDEESTEKAVEIIKAKSDYFNDNIEYKEDSHIIALYTCDYSKSKNGRLVVFYIEE